MLIERIHTPRYAGTTGVIREALKRLGKSNVYEIKVLDWRIEGESIISDVTDELDRESEFTIGPDWRVRRNKK